MWFINPFLESYHPQAKDYLEAATNRKRKILLSQIVYSNSSFNRSINKASDVMEINFLIKTLIEKGTLTKEEIAALMLVDIKNYKQDYLSKEDLETYVEKAKDQGFIDRKYNQVGHLCNLLWKLEDLVFIKNELCFKEDAKEIFGEDLHAVTKKRDPYLHVLYKKALKRESQELYKKVLCVVEKLDYPVLIASHIKPFIKSEESEAYDPNNGLLLSRTMDSLFDLKYISFNDEGQIIFSKRLSQTVRTFLEKQNYSLDQTILTEKRKMYLEYHRNLMHEIDWDNQ